MCQLKTIINNDKIATICYNDDNENLSSISTSNRIQHRQPRNSRWTKPHPPNNQESYCSTSTRSSSKKAARISYAMYMVFLLVNISCWYYYMLHTSVVYVNTVDTVFSSDNQFVEENTMMYMMSERFQVQQQRQQQQQQQQRQIEETKINDTSTEKNPDGYFNGIPVYYRGSTNTSESTINEKKNAIIESYVHCVGNNFGNIVNNENTKHIPQSCYFHNLCFDVENKDFVLFLPKKEKHILHLLLFEKEYRHRLMGNNGGDIHISTTMYESSLNITQNENKKLANEKGNAKKQSRKNTPVSKRVSLGGINYKWEKYHKQQNSDVNTLKWFPRIIDMEKDDVGANNNNHAENRINNFYDLPSNVVMVPYHSMSGTNPGHLVWDDFLPIYNLLDMFQLLPSNSNNKVLLPMRIEASSKEFANQQKLLWGTCESNNENRKICNKMYKKFIPLMVGNDYPFNLTTSNDILVNLLTQFKENNQQPMSSSNPTGLRLRKPNSDTDNQGITSTTNNYICIKNSASGIGLLTDHHYDHGHGWDVPDYNSNHNYGRGGLLYNFRNFMMSNILSHKNSNNNNEQSLFPTIYDIHSSSLNNEKKKPHKIVISLSSSEQRKSNFTKQIAQLQDHFLDKTNPQQESNIVIESYSMKDYTVEEQVNIVKDATFYISMCGGGAMTSMFLPFGGNVILYYYPAGGFTNGKFTGYPALLDWDLFNNLSYLKVHWLPITAMNTDIDIEILISLIEKEINFIDSRS